MIISQTLHSAITKDTYQIYLYYSYKGDYCHEDQELLSALSTLIDEKLDKKLDQKLEENNKKLKLFFDQKLEAAFDQKLTPIYQRLDHLEYQIKQTEYNLRNEIRRTENRFFSMR